MIDSKRGEPVVGICLVVTPSRPIQTHTRRQSEIDAELFFSSLIKSASSSSCGDPEDDDDSEDGDE